MLFLHYLFNHLNDILLRNCDNKALRWQSSLSLHINYLPVKYPLWKRLQLDALEVIHEVASDLKYLPIDNGDLSIFLAFSK